MSFQDIACEVFQADRVCSYGFHTRRQRVPVTPEWCTFQDLRSHKISSGNGFNLAAPRLDPANEVAREPQMAQYFANVYDRCLQFQIQAPTDRKSTRLNSSHVAISYAVFCLKK